MLTICTEVHESCSSAGSLALKRIRNTAMFIVLHFTTSYFHICYKLSLKNTVIIFPLTVSTRTHTLCLGG